MLKNVVETEKKKYVKWEKKWEHNEMIIKKICWKKWLRLRKKNMWNGKKKWEHNGICFLLLKAKSECDGVKAWEREHNGNKKNNPRKKMRA